ncbi:hypothetical protein QKT49_gp306 [Acanthamoeba castellanii medusavirus]|uniref:Uncharacterized protein n=1 Tax=Acanthamoeba castellanii medusavirus J1 TaxID=3114988 RepID=A0A3T1CX83_9VIRU|nr:hypothetical protein QKT49_gp306 [Acanthamoeba castellanii medusavirus]BBI30457.1 hypothetical protein [Acanthamoeba castellanii medusavirus J1]
MRARVGLFYKSGAIADPIEFATIAEMCLFSFSFVLVMRGPVSLFYSFKSWLGEWVVDFTAEVAFRVVEKKAQQKRLQAQAEAESDSSDSESESEPESDSSSSDSDCPFAEGELADEVFGLIDDVLDGLRTEEPICHYAIENLLVKNPAALGYVSIYCRESIHSARMDLVEQGGDANERDISRFLHRTSLLGEWLWTREEASRWPYAWSTHAWIVKSNGHWLREHYGAPQVDTSEPAETLVSDGEVSVGGEPVADPAA